MKEKEDILNEELKDSPLLKSLKGKNSFRTPDSFFDELEESIMSEISTQSPPAKSFRIGNKKFWSYAVAAILLALFVFIAIRSANSDENKPKIANDIEKTINKTDVPIADKENGKEDKLSNENINEKSGDNSREVEKVKPIENKALAVEGEKIQPEINPAHKPNNPQSEDQNNQDNNTALAVNTPLNTTPAGGSVNGLSTGQNTSAQNTSTAKSSVSRQDVTRLLNLDNSICSNKPVRLNALQEDIESVRYLWSTGDTTASVLADKSGFYSVKIFDLKGRFLASDSVDVKIVKTPQPKLGPDRSICNYESVLISSGCKSKDFTYKWSICEARTPEIYLNNLEPGNYNIILTVSSCADTVSSSMILEVKDCNIKIPNVITPNGDGRNDRFVIVGLNHYPGSNLYIMDRNGHIVYESMDYKNNWDAANVPDGTYFYRLQLNDGKNSEKSGTLTIIRK